MNLILKLLTFCVVLFIYMHVCFYLKKSNDLEIYEIDNFSKDKFEEVCNLRQPVIFNMALDCLDNLCFDNILNTYGPFDIKIQNLNGNKTFVPFTLKKAAEIIKTKESKYISEHNEEFLRETCLIKELKANDNMLRPYMVSNCYYDIIMGSDQSTTPLRYDLNCRNFLMIVQGNATIKLTPPKNSKYLYLDKDYENFEFNSLVNPWNVQDEYRSSFDKTQFLEVNITKGRLLFIPAYWWYSIKLGEDTVLASFKYRTFMNNVAIIPDLFMSLLQNQNIKHMTVKTTNMKESPHGSDHSDKNNTPSG